MGWPWRTLPMAATRLVAVAVAVAVATLLVRTLVVTRTLVALVTSVAGCKGRALGPANRRIDAMSMGHWRPVGLPVARLVLAVDRHPDLPLLDAVAAVVTATVVIHAGTIDRAIPAAMGMPVHRADRKSVV